MADTAQAAHKNDTKTKKQIRKSVFAAPVRSDKSRDVEDGPAGYETALSLFFHCMGVLLVGRACCKRRHVCDQLRRSGQADIGGDRYRLASYDTPETCKPECDCEKALGAAATRRARQRAPEVDTVDFAIRPTRDTYGRGCFCKIRTAGPFSSPKGWPGPMQAPVARAGVI